MNLGNFFAELKRRHVYKVAVAYVVIAWLLLQAGSILFPTFEAPGWMMKALVAAILVGFPIAVVIAWAFEMTPQGIKRADDLLPHERRTQWSARKFAALIASLAIVAGGLLLLQITRWNPGASATHGEHDEVSDKSIAVLPFENLSDDKQNAYFADGVQEEVLTTLAKVADLKVISRTSVMQFRDKEKRNLRDIARELGVAHILEGSVQRADNRVRVTAQLVDARTDSHIWADRYDGELADVFAMQTEIAQKITSQLKLALSEKEKEALQVRPTTDTTAYDLFLRARESYREGVAGDRDEIQKEVTLLDEAVARDPAFVPALCLLAQIHLAAYWFNLDHTPERLARANKALEAAARLQPDAGEVHLSRAVFHYWGNRDYAPALAELALAARHLPNDADILFLTGLIERRQGHWEKSLGTLERAFVLDPRNASLVLELAVNYSALKRYDDGRRVVDKFLAWKSDDLALQFSRAEMDLDENADLTRLQHVLSGVPGLDDQNRTTAKRLWVALFQRDYRTAAQTLSEYRLPDFSTTGFVTPREYIEGVIARRLGETAKAEAAFLRARESAAAMVAVRPDDAKALIVLAGIDAKLGRKEEAVREGERAVELLSVAKDALDGPKMLVRLAAVHADVSSNDRALEVLQQTVTLPNGLSYGDLTLDEDFDPLRQDSRFQKIVASVAPKSPSP